MPQPSLATAVLYNANLLRPSIRREIGRRPSHGHDGNCGSGFDAIYLESKYRTPENKRDVHSSVL